MGICNNCIYKGEAFSGGCRRRHLNDFQCTNPSNCDVDFVTGNIINGSCRMHNSIGQCKHFDDGTVPYYAWLNNEEIVYTLSTEPKEGDDYFTALPEEKGEEVFATGIITSSNNLYGWKNKNSLVYTKSETPEPGDCVYSLSGTTDMLVLSFDGKTALIGDLEYTRDSSSDVTCAFISIDKDEYFRDENYDERK